MTGPSIALTIALPAFDEAPNLEFVVEQARDAIRLIPERVEILIVDDGSTDGTSEIADALAGRYGEVRVIHHPQNRGFTGAMQSCITAADGEWIFLGAADGQIDIETARDFFAARGESDIIIGVREKRNDPVLRRFLSWGFHTLTRMTLGLPYKEFSSCFLFRARFVKGLRLISKPKGATILPEILFHANRSRARVVERTVRHLPRRAGRAKGADPRVILRSFRELLRLSFMLRRSR